MTEDKKVVIPVVKQDVSCPHLHGYVTGDKWRERANSKPMKVTRSKVKH